MAQSPYKLSCHWGGNKKHLLSLYYSMPFSHYKTLNTKKDLQHVHVGISHSLYICWTLINRPKHLLLVLKEMWIELPTRMLKLMDKKKNNQYFTLKMFITSIDMHLLNISKQCRPLSRTTSVVFDKCTHCWQQIMHYTFITPVPDLGEGMDSGAIVPWFYFWTSGSKGGVVLSFYSNFSSDDSVCFKLKQNTY